MAVIPSRSRAELVVTPGVSFRQEYNDNIHLVQHGQDDFITTVGPKITVVWLQDPSRLTLDYGLGFMLFAKHPENNKITLDQAQTALLQSTFNPVKDTLFLRLSDTYYRVPIDERRPVVVGNLITNMTNTNDLLVNPYLERPLTKTVTARIGYQYENVWYNEDAGNNTQIHTADVGLTKEFTPNFSTSLSYRYVLHRAAKSDSYNNQIETLGAAWQIMPRVSFNGSVGNTTFEYQGGGRTNTKSLVWTAQGAYLINDKFSLDGGYSENYADSVEQGTMKNESVKVTLSYLGRLPLAVSYQKTNSIYLDLSREDRSDGITVESNIPISLTPRLNGHISGTYSTYQFLPANEKVYKYSGSFSMEYEIKVTKIAFGYTYSVSDSKSVANDYKNNIAFVQANFTF